MAFADKNSLTLFWKTRINTDFCDYENIFIPNAVRRPRWRISSIPSVSKSALLYAYWSG